MIKMHIDPHKVFDFWNENKVRYENLVSYWNNEMNKISGWWNNESKPFCPINCI